MSSGPGNIVIRIGAQTSDAVRGLGQVNKSLGDTMTTSEKMQAGLKRAALPAAAALAAVGVAAKQAIDAASNLNEQINKTSTVFGDSGKDVQNWSKTLAKSFGMSQVAALEAAGTFGNMLVPMGFSRKEAAAMSKQMVQLAGDMASFNNASPEETLAAIQSGLAGQSEPLRKYGVFLNDARIKQEAMNQGLYSGKGALDAHAKAAATTAIILKDTADAQGDFMKTSESAANAQRVQAAQVENLKASLGQGLLPAYQAILAIMVKVLDITAKHQTAVKVLVGIIAGLAGAILAANAAFKVYAAAQAAVKVATAAWTAAQWLLNAALSANPVGLVVVAVAALAAGLVVAYKHSETFRNIVNAAFHAVANAGHTLAAAFTAVKNAALAAFDWIVGHWKLALFAFGPIGAALYVIVTNFDKIRAAASAAFGYITGAVNSVLGAINSVINAVESLISALGRIRVPSIKLPHIPGTLILEPVSAGAGAGSRTAGATATSSAGAITINVAGAIDPEGTARAIIRTLQRHERRQGKRW
jgi:phage-related protein